MRKLILRNVLDMLLPYIVTFVPAPFHITLLLFFGRIFITKQLQVVFCVQNTYCFYSLLVTHVSFYCTTHGGGRNDLQRVFYLFGYDSLWWAKSSLVLSQVFPQRPASSCCCSAC